MNEKLNEIKPSYYGKQENNLNEWLEIKEEIPKEFWEKIKNLDQEKDLNIMLLKIKKELFSFYGDKRDQARSFKDSRFTSLPEMIERGMATCGSVTKIIGIILRKFGIPTKFIHGILKSQKESFIKRVLKKSRHAWLEIYNPKTDEWLPVDMTRNDFSIYSDAEKIKEYHDWEELKADYKNGNF